MRALVRLPAAVAAGLMLISCASAPAPTPDPGQPPTPGPPAGTPPQPSPGQPTALRPTISPPATAGPPATHGSPAPTGPIDPNGEDWAYLADFPVGEALAVSAVAATSEGFVAVGYQPAEGEGPDGIRQGVVWTSTDGIGWQRSTHEAFAGASLDHVIELDGELFVFGYVSTCPAFDEDCPQLAEAGNAGWRRAADGWSRLTLPPLMPGAVIEGVAVGFDRLVVRGTLGDEEVEQALWLSHDGERWETVTELAEIGFISELVEGAGVLVGLGTSYDFDSDRISTEAIYSSDGRSFQPAELPAALQVAVDGVAHGPAGLVAVGNQVPADPPEAGATVLRSEDGIRWTAEQPAALRGHAAVAVHAVPGGFVALGSLALTDAGEPQAGVAWSSTDGQAWQAIQPYDDAPFSEVTATAAGPAGIVIFAIELSDERPVVHAWFGGSRVFALP